MHDAVHLSGPVLAGLHDERPEAWMAGGRITYVAPPGPVARTVAGWAVPGLVDAHCHIGLVPGGAPDDAAALAHARTEAAAGVLLVRDCGSPTDTRWLQARDDVPRLVRAGRHLARSHRYLRGLAHEVAPEGLVEAVRKEARAGDGWVKLVADWIDREAGDLAPAFPPAIVREAVAAAHAEGARVTAHTFAEETIDHLIDAGIDCLEHATGLQERHLPRLADAGIPIVPTLVNIATFPQIAATGEAKFPRYAAHMRALWERRHERIAAAHAAGVPVYAGTDAGTVIAHGRIADEVAELAVAIGPAAALDAACWSSRRWLGVAALDEGEAADVVVVADDPRRDVGTLAAPLAVFRNGALVAGRGVGEGISPVD
ncbi:amidohydrolase family protein [Sinomonas sp. ASV486]|uniref:amidohydrolase family protein n=1 Tax=Sinomonas sp. ASV486 TaxID=3051170 RepID=UPI0027DB905E|nr:amidohydrolase family protein [Sinomonas sp. ASV486]MDQ4490688.1 amidohydrolase family protein [Sinomonas sp. ASV486]